MLSPDLAFSVCSPVERRDTVRCSLVRHPWSWLASTSVLCFRFKHLLLCQFSAVLLGQGVPAVWLASEEEANIGIRLPWP